MPFRMQIAVTILHLIFSISLIVIVLLQSGRRAGLSGSIAGGAETFFGKNKGRTIDAILGKYTAVAAIGFLITSVVLQLIINSK
ncbi:preprotein translocase, SecG subunit [Acetivibrio thermocellus ATCC 27405]|uniref:Protein-export membrane protein SecG n=2 Tax=Acetivibrio thermocellus TaxID=1515 RepID=A3DBQ6_ACET2|nr:preprotein translocase, SecG subunit [Acetivibrio thermocellus ATCC 27405]